jgi:hypothetical protein
MGSEGNTKEEGGPRGEKKNEKKKKKLLSVEVLLFAILFWISRDMEFAFFTSHAFLSHLPHFLASHFRSLS